MCLVVVGVLPCLLTGDIFIDGAKEIKWDEWIRDQTRSNIFDEISIDWRAVLYNFIITDE